MRPSPFFIVQQMGPIEALGENTRSHQHGSRKLCYGEEKYEDGRKRGARKLPEKSEMAVMHISQTTLK